MSWNLPPGCTPWHIEEAAGAFDDPERCLDCDAFPCICDPQDEEDYHTGNVCPVCGDWVTGIEMDAALTIWYSPFPEVEAEESFVHGDCAECGQSDLGARLRAAIVEAKHHVDL